VREKRYLDLIQHQRSADVFLGLPFNLVGYGFLLHILAMEVGLKPGILQINLGDAHLYENHLAQAAQYLAQPKHRLPIISIDKQPLFEYTLDDVRILDYRHGPWIGAPVSV
jgi:thymidylate synthase